MSHKLRCCRPKSAAAVVQLIRDKALPLGRYGPVTLSSGTIGSLYLVDPFLPRPSIFADPGRPGVIYLADAGLNC